MRDFPTGSIRILDADMNHENKLEMRTDKDACMRRDNEQTGVRRRGEGHGVGQEVREFV